jgi:hypothetical protein
MQPLPAPPEIQSRGRPVGIAAIVAGVLGLFVLPIIFGPIAIILGTVAVVQGYRGAWLGIIGGGFQVAIVAKAFLDLSNALS